MDDKVQAVCFFNNCHNRDHIALYGSGAFFDLMNSGRQATQARDLIPGQTCVVASNSDDGQLAFSWYSFTHEARCLAPSLFSLNGCIQRMSTSLLTMASWAGSASDLAAAFVSFLGVSPHKDVIFAKSRRISRRPFRLNRALLWRARAGE